VDYMKRHQIRAASAAVMRNGKLVYTQGYGTADVPQVPGKNGQLATSATPFRLASVSKPITAIAIMVAQQQGWLRVDDKVFAPGGRLHDLVRNPKPGFEAGANDVRINQVTIRHLLQHTGGWMGQSGWPRRSPMFKSRRISQDFGILGPATCLDTIKWMLGTKLDSTPGTVYSYSNLGYCILGHLLEVIAKKSYEQVVQELVLVPAGIDPKEMYEGHTQDALGWEAHQCVGNNWPSNFVGPPPKTTPDALTVAVCPGSECKLSGQSCLEGDGYCCGTDLRWREGMCAPLTTPTTPTTTLAPATAPPGVNWTCSLSDIVMANYCSSGYPFIAASHDCHYSWYSSSASDAVSSCTNAAGYTCYVYDQYGTRCR